MPKAHIAAELYRAEWHIANSEVPAHTSSAPSGHLLLKEKAREGHDPPLQWCKGCVRGRVRDAARYGFVGVGCGQPPDGCAVFPLQRGILWGACEALRGGDVMNKNMEVF